MSKRILLLSISVVLLSACTGIKANKTMIKLMMSAASKEITGLTYADSCECRIGIPYVENGNERQVIDVYYASVNRKNAALIDIHGGFYIAGTRRNNRFFASEFLKEGFDVVMVEYRLCDGQVDVSDELADCAAALDYVALHADELGLNGDAMFVTGDSAGGHLALYLAEGAEDPSLPVHPEHFRAQGVLVNCPAYDYASFGSTATFTKSALEFFIGPRWSDAEWLKSMSARTYLKSYSGPLFVSTCRNDFIRVQSFILKDDCDALGRPLEFVDIDARDARVGHVHNVVTPSLPESREVNGAMAAFMERVLASAEFCNAGRHNR